LRLDRGGSFIAVLTGIENLSEEEIKEKEKEILSVYKKVAEEIQLFYLTSACLFFKLIMLVIMVPPNRQKYNKLLEAF